MPKILKEYIKYIEQVKNYSRSTIVSYIHDILLFFNYIQKYKDIKQINIFTLMQIKKQDAISFIIYLNYNRDNRPSTRKRRINAIRSLYRFLIYKYPTYDIKMPINAYWIEQIERLPKYLTLDEVKHIKNIFTIQNSRNHRRDNLIIETFLITGIRRTELSNINIQDINFEEKYIKIIAKGNIERKVFINEYLKCKLEDYTKNRDKTEPLFKNKNGERLKKDGIDRICKKAMEMLDHKDYSCHTLRHTAAMLIYSQNQDILLLKEYLGHKSVNTTQIYSHLLNNEVRKAVENNPLNHIA